MRLLSAIAAILISSTALLAQAPQPPANQNSPDSLPTMRVNVKLVNVFATVTDAEGAPVGGLARDNFKLYEDGELQKISVFDRESALPLSIVMAVDTSLSTRKDLPLELESARRFAHVILRPIDAMSIYQFNDAVDEVQGYTSDLKRIDRSISSIRGGGATALYDAVYLASQSLVPRQGRKVMVIITDGGDTASHTDYAEALRAAQIAESIVYPIIMVPVEASAGRDTGGEHALMQMARDTGGKYYYASNIAELDKVFRQIDEELRTQYLLGYYPPKRSQKDFRHITIEVVPKPGESDYKVRNRAGYYTSKIE